MVTQLLVMPVARMTSEGVNPQEIVLPKIESIEESLAARDTEVTIAIPAVAASAYPRTFFDHVCMVAICIKYKNIIPLFDTNTTTKIKTLCVKIV